MIWCACFEGDRCGFEGRAWAGCAIMGSMKANLESVNGPETMTRLDAVVRKVLSVSHEEIMRREAEYRLQSIANPNRRGPKPKIKPSA